MFYGSLNLTKVSIGPAFSSWHSKPETETGRHTEARGFIGQWHTNVDREYRVVKYAPHREKEIVVDCTSKDAIGFLSDAIPKLDSQRGDNEDYRKKLREIARASSNDNATVVNTRGPHGSIILMSKNQPIHLYVVSDASSAALCWSDERGTEAHIRAVDPTRYMIYRMPLIIDTAILIPTQIVCSRYWGWLKTFDQQKMGPLRCLSSLEYLLFRYMNC